VFTSVQVNVDALGNNIIGDAANEPSMAISPIDPNQIVIGWRQFDSVSSDFREAGYAYSHDAGQTWTFPGVLEDDVFRSDPVLGADADGNFYYYSLTIEEDPPNITFLVDLFKSIDGGLTWPQSVFAFGGDKQWMTIDRTAGIGRGNIYGHWNRSFSCCGNTDFSRSVDGGASFEDPIQLPSPSMKWGTLDVAADGTLFLAGAQRNGSGHVIARSTNAKDPNASPVFDLVDVVTLGGPTVSGGINPAGLLGDVWIATSQPRGELYILASVNPPGPDPLDVLFIRSSDEGETWSKPVRVNDNPAGDGTWQWFGTMSVAPSGRIDAIWNDTRNDPSNYRSEVFYSYSLNGGRTWSSNVAVTPSFDPALGYPQQAKLGDYYHMISDDEGASLAYAATFNSEQDVYFLRIPCEPSVCTAICGDGEVTSLEECDDGNLDDEDGCTSACTICGNGVVTSPEECDDGNLTGGDECGPDCIATTTGLTGRRLFVEGLFSDSLQVHFIRKLRALSKDPFITTSPQGSGGDPTLNGALLTLYNPFGETESLTLPAEYWRAVGDAAEKGYKYKDSSGLSPCRRVEVRPGKRIRASCGGEAISFSLDETSQGAMGFKLQLGTDPVFCTLFDDSSDIRQDYGTDAKPNGRGRFRARNAPAPESCPVP
jgi:cysteine-rich repeat protein